MINRREDNRIGAQREDGVLPPGTRQAAGVVGRVVVEQQHPRETGTPFGRRALLPEGRRGCGPVR